MGRTAERRRWPLGLRILLILGAPALFWLGLGALILHSHRF